jgi:hypothetical protein
MNESVKSRYRPKNPAKYKGNPNNIICRSNWEKKFCQWCDTNESIILWASEEFSIPYRSPLDNRVHQYYPDFLIKVKEGNGSIRDYVIEVKPKRQCSPPKKKSKVTKGYIYESKEYAKNQAKWEAAQEWCKDRRLIFKVITEDELGIKYK